MKKLLAFGATSMFRGLRKGEPFTAGLGASLVVFGLIRRAVRGRPQRLFSRKMNPGDEIAIRVER